MGSTQTRLSNISSSLNQKEALEYLLNRHSTAQQLAKRATIIRLLQQNYRITAISREVGVTLNTVKKWRGRWINAQEELIKFESHLSSAQISIQDFRKFIQSILSDLPRSGTPKKITLAQEQQIVAIACDEPAHHGIPITDWTYETLAQVAIAKQIIDTISPRQVGRVLKK